jgi:hypothetical protein
MNKHKLRPDVDRCAAARRHEYVTLAWQRCVSFSDQKAKWKRCGSLTARSIVRIKMPTALPESGMTGGTAALGSWTMTTLKRTSVIGLFVTPTARFRSPLRPISRGITGLHGFGWHKGRLSDSGEKLNGANMRAVRMVLAVLCFVIGTAFGFGAAETIFYSTYDDSEAFWLPAIFAAIFLLGGFLLLRRPQARQTEPPNQR